MKQKSKQCVWIVTSTVPSLRSGYHVRIYNLVKQYVRLGYNVVVFCIPDRSQGDDVSPLRKELDIDIYEAEAPRNSLLHIVTSVCRYRIKPEMYQYRSSGLERLVLQIAENRMPDIMQIEHVQAYHAIQTAVTYCKERGATIILDAHNVEQELFQQIMHNSKLFEKLRDRWLFPVFCELEDTATALADAVFTCSKKDSTFFRSTKGDNVYVVPNGVDCDWFTMGEPANPTSMLFMGGVHHPPNEEALKWYFKYIHPGVKRQVRHLTLYVLGNQPPMWLQRLAAKDSSIVTPGRVADVRDYLNRANVCISPMLSGSGTALKILEYMAAGRPVVSTSVGVRGLAVDDHRNVRVADDAEDFSRHVVELLQDKKASRKLGNAAQQLVRQTYDWNIIGDAMNTFVQNIMSRRQAQ